MTAKRLIAGKTTPAQRALGQVAKLADLSADLQVEQADAYARLVTAIREAVKAGVSGAEVARAAGLSRQRVSQVVHGE